MVSCLNSRSKGRYSRLGKRQIPEIGEHFGSQPEQPSLKSPTGRADCDSSVLQLGPGLPAKPVLGEKHSIVCPSALIGASNFFELAAAAAISLFGFHSRAALATVVGVLIEVPMTPLVVRVVNSSKAWYESGTNSA